MPARTLGLAALLGFAIGVLAGLYLAVVRVLEHLIWDGYEPRLPGPTWLGMLMVCVGGGALVGLLRVRHDRDTPHDLEDTLAVLDRVVSVEPGEPPPPIPKVRWLARSGALGVVSLAAGGSLGPEAPLLALAMGLGQRTARLLRLSSSESAYLSSAGALSGLFGGPLGPVALPVEGSRRPMFAGRMVAPGLVAGLMGLIGLLLVLPSRHGPFYDLPDAGVDTVADLLVALAWGALGAVPAAFGGLALLLSMAPLRRLGERLVPWVLPRAMAGGLVLAVCGLVAPLTLFSGEHQAQELVDTIAERSAWGLLALAALKILATLACLTTGWFGGHIFPAVFVGMAAALIVVAVFPDAPVTPLAAAGAGAAGVAVLRRPVAMILLLLLFFPLAVAPALIMGAVVAVAMVSVLGERAPAPFPGVGAH